MASNLEHVTQPHTRVLWNLEQEGGTLLARNKKLINNVQGWGRKQELKHRQLPPRLERQRENTWRNLWPYPWMDFKTNEEKSNDETNYRYTCFARGRYTSPHSSHDAAWYPPADNLSKQLSFWKLKPHKIIKLISFYSHYLIPSSSWH